ncbi:MAG: branched-chain amino acid ABC transporter permease [Armatimonadota bacterium]|nr:branched-chain amino acid ABC transporter permease [Armatimonadota bacterium]MDR7486356.1 branched-chain amino acid ABC transporter permease [Armatimonadota bacterium]MDR7534233.1 branched-chain amino acid ABC transporter permease [Armatimonadota bacterium]MDR7536751.1 branched-chain amino acid ABC transporter permease [Armatimonadota bacterium]
MNRPALLTALAAALYLGIVPYAIHRAPYYLTVLTTASLLAFVSLGVWLTFTIGRINIAQGAFALLGGYVTAILTTRAGASFWLALPAAGAVAAAAGTAIGWVTLRLRGVYFAMLTLSLTEAMRLAALNFEGLTQGATGILGVPTPGPVRVAGRTLLPAFDALNTHLAFYYLAAGLLLAGLAVVHRLTTCRLGWTFRALRQNEELAASIGIDVPRLRVLAFTIACAFGGIGGGVFTAQQQSIYPSSFGVTDSVFFMLYCFLGGLSSVFGPVVGAFVLFLSFELLAGLRQYQTLVYAIIMILTMLWFPNGLLGLRPRKPVGALGAMFSRLRPTRWISARPATPQGDSDPPSR